MSLKIKGERDYEKKPRCCGTCTAYCGVDQWRGQCTAKGKLVYGVLPQCNKCPGDKNGAQ